jgi:tetratricopeptide (TPR) repeat protein
MVETANEKQTLAAALRQGIALFQQGYFAEAEAVITGIQRRHPGDFDVLHVLGIMQVQGGAPERGVALIERALAVRKDFAPAHNNLGNGYRRLGRLDEALAAYDRAIALQSGFGEAYNNRGNTLVVLGRAQEALADFEKAAQLDPHLVEAHSNRAVALLRLHRPAEALSAAEVALALQPGSAEAYVAKADAMLALGFGDAALASADTAIRLKPNMAEAHICHANILLAASRNEKAIAGYDNAIALNSGLAAAHNNRGNALREIGRNQEALTSYDRAIRLRPDFAEAFNNRGKALGDLYGPEAALESYDRAIALAPDYAAAHSNRGNMLLILGRPEQALAGHDTAIALQPENFRAHNNRGNALLDMKLPDEALQSYERAIALRPDYAEGHWNCGIALLLKGNLEKGWLEYAFRHRCVGFGAPQDIHPAERLWTGAQSLAGKMLLMHCEQGLGDTIQFCRYALVARSMGASVLLAPQKGLERLLSALDPGITVVDSTASPAFDYHIPLLDMPLACRTRLTDIPAPIPYLSAEAERRAQWRDRIGAHGFKIGICWQGNRAAPSDIGRSFPVRNFERIGRLDGVRLISLQKGAGAEQLDDLPTGMVVERLSPFFDDGPDAFIDTAAVMANLDLVITSDTAVAHLAGALGRPTLLALKYVADWRWLLDRDDSPWYPNVRLFRQRAHGDWPDVFKRIETHLLGLMQR